MKKNTKRFTIQNVPIKSWMGYIVSRGSYAFTIQNVPIKSMK